MTKYQIKKTGLSQIEISKPGEYLVEILESLTEVEISGVFKSTKTQKKEVNLTIVHKAPHTRANTTLKGVAYDKSYIKFFGRIVIEPSCPDTNSFLTEKILLLSDQAKAEAIPELEIESDDVKCSHAATISNIPSEHLFYLMSRGISKKTAEDLIVEGFLG